MNKLETLKTALTARDDEVMTYQINIDNFTRAIAKIDAQHSDNPAMVEFRGRLAEMLLSNKTEQLKAIVIRDVIAEQVDELKALEVPEATKTENS